MPDFISHNLKMQVHKQSSYRNAFADKIKNTRGGRENESG